MMINLPGNVLNFDEPIEAMMKCHDIILAQMKRIEQMAAEIGQEGLPAFRRQVDQWREILSFIKYTIADHTRDEEEGLFPMVEHELGSAVELMRFEHSWIKQSEELFFNLFESLTASDADIDASEVGEFALSAKEIAYFYRNHIREENDVFLPPAKGVLTEEQKHELADLMRKHRSLEATVV
jgi:hemerythrin-like domain-containing protein